MAQSSTWCHDAPVCAEEQYEESSEVGNARLFVRCDEAQIERKCTKSLHSSYTASNGLFISRYISNFRNSTHLFRKTGRFIEGDWPAEAVLLLQDRDAEAGSFQRNCKVGVFDGGFGQGCPRVCSVRIELHWRIQIRRASALADALRGFELCGSYLLPWNSVPFSSRLACAAASRAVRRRKGEQET
jgi:hypothetical protein